MLERRSSSEGAEYGAELAVKVVPAAEQRLPSSLSAGPVPLSVCGTAPLLQPAENKCLLDIDSDWSPPPPPRALIG